MKTSKVLAPFLFSILASQASALSLAPEEFQASRKLACVLAEQSLGYLSEEEYGSRTHAVLGDFDETERDKLLAKALGYYDGLMFSIEASNTVQVNERLASFVHSNSCTGGYHAVTLTL